MADEQDEQDHSDESKTPDDKKKEAGSTAHEVAETVIEAQKSVEQLRQKAAEAESKLESAKKELKSSEDELKEKAGDHKKPTVAGYPVTELLTAPLHPPKPVDEEKGDPEAKEKLDEVSEQKKVVEQASKEIGAIKKEAEKFNQHEAKATQKLSDIINESQS